MAIMPIQGAFQIGHGTLPSEPIRVEQGNPGGRSTTLQSRGRT